MVLVYEYFDCPPPLQVVEFYLKTKPYAVINVLNPFIAIPESAFFLRNIICADAFLV